eukprot:SAG31_NODE_2020_length_6659_cov_1.685976_3_plen_79_part_00
MWGGGGVLGGEMQLCCEAVSSPGRQRSRAPKYRTAVQLYQCAMPMRNANANPRPGAGGTRAAGAKFSGVHVLKCTAKY